MEYFLTMQHLTFLAVIVYLLASQSNAKGRVWIKYEHGHHETVASDMPFSSEIHYHFHELDSFVISATKEELRRLEAHPRVLTIAEDVVRYQFGGPRRRNQLRWDAQAASYGFSMVQADVLQREHGLTGANITICVPDTGIDTTHEDLDSSKLSGDIVVEDLPWDIDDQGHGTFIGGILGAQDNDIGLVGVAPEAHIHSIRIFAETEVVVYVSAVVEALIMCRDAGVQIASLSFGGPVFSTPEFDIITDMYENHGILTIAAAGNSGDDTLFYPASYSHVISVGSVNEMQDIWESSTQNAMIDLVAPGQAIWSTLPQNFDCIFCADLATSTYGALEGTSFACPYVAGIAALLWSEDTTVDVRHIFNALLASAADLGDEGKDVTFGLGLVQGAAAYDVLQSTLNGTDVITFEGGACSEGHVGLRVAMLTDQYSFAETYWEVSRNNDNFTVLAGTGLLGNTLHISNACLPQDCYNFRAYDSGGDGICCTSGQGSLEVSIDGAVILDGNFTSDSIAVDFGGECSTFPVQEKEPCTNFYMTLRTDEYPEEISVLLESTTGETWWSDVLFPFDLFDFSFIECLDPSQCYKFTLFDLYDCLYEPGMLELRFGEDVVFSGLPEFELEFSLFFGQGCPTEAPTMSPTESPGGIVPETPIDSRTGGISNETMDSLVGLIQDTLTRGVEAPTNP